MSAPSPVRDALALAGLVRDCVASGVARRALILRLDRLPPHLREARHRRLIEEAVAPLRRPTRARVFLLPGDGLAAVAPPPGQHLDEALAALQRLLPEPEARPAFQLVRLPAEAALLLTAVEDSLGLSDPPGPSAASGAPPSEAQLDAAIRALAQADLSPHHRRAGVWTMSPSGGPATPEREELRLHLPGLAAALLPGHSLAGTPGPARRLRVAAERRFLAGLTAGGAPREVLLPLALPTALSEEFLRFEGRLGPDGRRGLLVCLPAEEVLGDPAAALALARHAARRGWALGLDLADAAQLRLLSPAAPVAALRWRYQPGGEGEALRPGWAERAILTGADGAAAIGWGWKHGVTRFMGRVVEAG